MFKRKVFNDTLALMIVVGIPMLWLSGKWLPMPSEATGASIVAWTMVIQFYFRKSPTDNGNGKPKE